MILPSRNRAGGIHPSSPAGGKAQPQIMKKPVVEQKLRRLSARDGLSPFTRSSSFDIWIRAGVRAWPDLLAALSEV